MSKPTEPECPLLGAKRPFCADGRVLGPFAGEGRAQGSDREISWPKSHGPNLIAQISWPKENRTSCRDPRRSFVLWMQSARAEYLDHEKIAAITHTRSTASCNYPEPANDPQVAVFTAASTG
jgi:hypothetical protein